MSAIVQSMPLARLSREQAEAVAIQILGFIGSDPYRTRDFVEASGLTPTAMRAAAASPWFFLGVLDYISANDRLLMSFAIATHTHPQTVAVARDALAPRKSTAKHVPAAPLRLRCEHCGVTELRQRRDFPHVPPNVATIVAARCGPCGGGFDGPETWLDGRGNEVG